MHSLFVFCEIKIYSLSSDVNLLKMQFYDEIFE